MELKVWKLYNKWMYLWNTEDLYIDWWELSWDWRNVFLRDDSIYDTRDTDILEDNDDMLPWAIVYDWETYLLSISTCMASNIVFRLNYISNDKLIYSNDWESVNELIEHFNKHRKSTGYPKEIRYVY